MRDIIADLQARRSLTSALIGMLRDDPDPRAPGAIERLQGQQREINRRLVAEIRAERQARGDPEPEPVVIGLKPVALRGRARR